MALEVEIKALIVREDDEGVILNPRGSITDTTDLQDSFNAVGQIEPIKIYVAPGGEDQTDTRFYILDGHRRVTAARALGWKTIKAEEVPAPKDEQTALLQMLATAVRQPIPHSRKGESIKKLVTKYGMTIERAAQALGIRKWMADALVALTEEDTALRQRVDKGEMSITAYREVRDKPRAIKDKVAEMDKPSVRAVRNAMKDDETKDDSNTLVKAKAMDENWLVPELNALLAKVRAMRHSLPNGDVDRALYIVDEITKALEAPNLS